MQAKLSQIQNRLEEVRERIEKAASMAGRKSNDIELLPVSKTVSNDKITEIIKLGINRLAENRVQEALKKSDALSNLKIEFDLIGPLQKNKAKKAAKLFRRVHSLEKAEVALALSKYAQELGRKIDVLVEVNGSGEPTKHGLVDSGEVKELIELCVSLPGLMPKGLMTLGPFPPGEAASRKTFAMLRKIRDHCAQSLGLELPALSMGMSQDMEWAIQEGATIVRIGTAIFGDR